MDLIVPKEGGVELDSELATGDGAAGDGRPGKRTFTAIHCVVRCSTETVADGLLGTRMDATHHGHCVDIYGARGCTLLGVLGRADGSIAALSTAQPNVKARARVWSPGVVLRGGVQVRKQKVEPLDMA